MNAPTSNAEFARVAACRPAGRSLGPACSWTPRHPDVARLAKGRTWPAAQRHLWAPASDGRHDGPTRRASGTLDTRETRGRWRLGTSSSTTVGPGSLKVHDPVRMGQCQEAPLVLGGASRHQERARRAPVGEVTELARELDLAAHNPPTPRVAASSLCPATEDRRPSRGAVASGTSRPPGSGSGAETSERALRPTAPDHRRPAVLAVDEAARRTL